MEYIRTLEVKRMRRKGATGKKGKWSISAPSADVNKLSAHCGQRERRENRMKNNSTTRFLGIIFVSLIAFAMAPTVCIAEEWSRKGKSEIYGLGQSMGGDTTTGLGATLKLGDSTAWGLGFGKNFSDNLNLNMDMFFSSKDMAGKMGSYEDKGSADLLGFDVNLDVNILKGRFTPMITGGIGLIKFSGDWEKGLPFDETDFSWNVGVGFRWDVTNHFLIKAIYRATWTKMKDTDKSVLFDGIALSIGYIF